MKKSIFYISIIAVFLIWFASCKKDDTNTTVDTGKFMLHLHTNIDTSEAEIGNTYHDAAGRQIMPTVAQFYISNVRLKKADGTFNTIAGAYLLKTPDEEEYMVGKAPVGDYVSVSFDVGVDATNNHNAPSSFPDTSALHIQNDTTWYGSTTQGYVFLNIQGMVDTSAGNNGIVNFPISYKIGSDANLKTVNMPDRAFTIPKDQTQIVHIICDYGAVLTGIDFKTQSSTTSYTNAAVATQIANNIPIHMFRYEQ